ncbi:MAG: MBL fold metallo-hydrolase, partial [Nitriliruptorales bacterium]
PGEDAADWVPGALDEHEVACRAVLLTHGHLDHIWAVPELAQKLDAPVLLHPGDRWLWDDPGGGIGMPRGALEPFMGRPWEPPTDRLEDVADGQVLDVGGIELTARHTPGHTPGHCAFLATGVGGATVSFGGSTEAPQEGILLSGDLIFAGSVGRTDFPRGSTQQLLDSIDRTVLPLDDATLVLSGHGPATTVGRERSSNPFVAEILARGMPRGRHL